MELVFKILIVIIAWVLLNSVVTYFSGWYKLAKVYKAKIKPEGESHYFHSGLGNWWVLNFTISPQGLYMSLMPPFNLVSPPLLIPWDEIKVNSDWTFRYAKTNVYIKHVDLKLHLPTDILKASEKYIQLKNKGSSE